MSNLTEDNSHACILFSSCGAHGLISCALQDIAPLEMHHCAATFMVAADPEANIFQAMRSDDRATLRASMIDLILGTLAAI